MVHKIKKIKLYQIHDVAEGYVFWTTVPPLDKTEKIVKTRLFPVPLKSGFHDRDYLSSIDVKSVKKEIMVGQDQLRRGKR